MSVATTATSRLPAPPLALRRSSGATCYNDYDRAAAMAAAGTDYVAFGAMYVSPTKPNAVRAPLELLRRAHDELSLPVAAIGGITIDNAPALIASGADLLAVISDVFSAPDPRARVVQYRCAFRQTVCNPGCRTDRLMQRSGTAPKEPRNSSPVAIRNSSSAPSGRYRAGQLRRYGLFARSAARPASSSAPRAAGYGMPTGDPTSTTWAPGARRLPVTLIQR